VADYPEAKRTKDKAIFISFLSPKFISFQFEVKFKYMPELQQEEKHNYIPMTEFNKA
jgi:hypothetical protein